MKRYSIFLLIFLFTLSSAAQQRRTTQRRATTTQKRTTAQRKPATKKQRKATTQKSTKKTTTQKQGSGPRQPKYSTAEIKGLENQRNQIQRNINEQQKKLSANKADVKKRLQNLMVINGEIASHQRAIEGYQADIQHLDENINILNAQLATLEQQLREKKQQFVKSMQYLTKNRNTQDKLMFVFSAKNLTQSYRRLRFVREYAAYQRTLGEQIKAKQAEISNKNQQLAVAKSDKNTLLNKGKQEQSILQTKQNEQQQMVKNLQSQQKTIQGIINEQQKQQASLNAQIDRLVAIEVEKARKRAIEEARRKAAAEAEAKRKREAELARKRAEAELAARENERRIAEAREKEARMKAAAAKTANKNSAEKEAANQAAREAEAERIAAERKANADKARREKDIAETKKNNEEAGMVSSVDRKISGSFENNKGRLPIPITGSYRITRHFGNYNVEGLRNVKLNSKGINIQGQSGAQARSIFDGEVCAVFSYGGQMNVMVRHGSYISVYSNLRSVSVQKGQKVSTRQTLGTVGTDNTLQFQLRRETALLNPESWLGR